jgi:hypothetical protein
MERHVASHPTAGEELEPAGRADTTQERVRPPDEERAELERSPTHFLDAEARGTRGHGLARVEWLSSLDGLDPSWCP